MELLIFILGFLIGWRCHRLAMLNRHMIEKHNQLIEQDHNPDQIPQIDCVLEKYQNQYFLYQHSDMKFLAQGDNIKAIEEKLNHHFPYPIIIKIKENYNENSIGQ
jgi:hypothetical protein